jgi:hypothetical protein
MLAGPAEQGNVDTDAYLEVMVYAVLVEIVGALAHAAGLTPSSELSDSSEAGIMGL